MKRGLATFLTGILTVTLVAAALTGCGSSTADKRSEKVRLMVWSPSEDQSKDSGEWLQTMCNTFAKEHPEWDITFVYGVADEATAADQVAQDPEASADVFMYANDRITTLTDADAVAKFGGKYKEEIESTNSEELLDSLKVDGELYGVPFTTNTWYMFYDKSVFSEEDVKNLDTMLEKEQYPSLLLIRGIFRHFTWEMDAPCLEMEQTSQKELILQEKRQWRQPIMQLIWQPIQILKLMQMDQHLQDFVMAA